MRQKSDVFIFNDGAKRLSARLPDRALSVGVGWSAGCHETQKGLAANVAQPLDAFHAKLNAKETATIERLIDICTQFEVEGQSDLSEIVDRIGLKMMRAFMDRPPYQNVGTGE